MKLANPYARKAYNRVVSLYASGSPLRHVRKYLHYALNFSTYRNRKNILQTVTIDKTHQRILADLAANGYAMVTNEIDLGLLQNLEEQVQSQAQNNPTGQTVKARGYFGEILTPENYKTDGIFVRFSLQKIILEVAAAYFGEAPKISSLNVLVSRASTSINWEEAQLWHRDYNDTRTLKLFVYLTDVDDDGAGPFTFIPAPYSKNIKNDHIIPRRMSDERMREKGGAKHAKSIYGKRGTAFLIDTYRCFHLGSRCKTRDRMALIVAYNTMAELFPFTPPFKHIDRDLTPLESMALKP